MFEIDYKEYLDKVYGCYLGVSIGGLVGAPYEGAKEIIDVPIDLSGIDQMLFNDDLDLQVLFFQAVEKFGVRFNANMLANLFLKCCPYSPGEYAIFKKNYARGILPPISGTFNNEFYHEGMGCCIRGELWGCLFPNDPQTAKKYAYFDGCMDHANESIYSEYFVASLIAYSFVYSDIDRIIRLATEQVPQESKFRLMLETVSSWCDETSHPDALREKIIREFGHPDCTNVFQNLAFIVAGLKMYFNDFETLIEKTVRLGFDTDCTGGIVAAVWGAVHGASVLQKKYGIDEVKLVLGVNCPDYSGKVSKFAEAVAQKGASFNDEDRSGVKIVNAPLPHEICKQSVLYELVDYDPVLEFATMKTVKIRADVPEGRTGEFFYENDRLKTVFFSTEKEGDGYLLTLGVLLEKAPQTPADLCGKIVFETADGIDEDDCIPLGFAPPVIFEVSAPIFDTFEHIVFEKGKNYYGHFAGEQDENKRFDRIRDYHLNYKIPLQDERDFALRISRGEPFSNQKVIVYTDKLYSERLTGYRGPCLLYLRRKLYFGNDCICAIWCGCEGRAEVWLNGEKLAENHQNTFFTYENLHINRAKMKCGENDLVIKLWRETGKECFSCNILNEGGVMDFPEHVLNFKQIN